MTLNMKTISKICLALIALLTVSCAKKVEVSESVSSDVAIPTVIGGCLTAYCSAGVSSKPAHSGVFATDCATLLSGGGANTSRSSSTIMACNNSACGASFNSWTDGDNNSTSVIPVGTYAVAVVFDHDGNFSGSPSAGDTICCEEKEIASGASDITVTACNDL